MQIRLEVAPLEQVDADALVVPIFDKESPGGGLPSESAQVANDLAGGWIEELYRSGEFSGKEFETAMLYRPPGIRARRLLVVGAGKSDRFTPAGLRKVTGAALRFLKPKSAPTIALALDAGEAAAEQAAAAVEGAILGDFEPDQLKTDKKDVKFVDTFTVVVPGGDESLGQTMWTAQVLAEAQNLARTLISEPANRMTPATLAARVIRSNAAGPLANLELVRLDTGGQFTVQLSKEQFQQLQLKAGEPVFVELRNVKVFSDDYSI